MADEESVTKGNMLSRGVSRVRDAAQGAATGMMGGPVISIKPVNDSVHALAVEINSLVKAIMDARVSILSSSKKVEGSSNGSADRTWNSQSHFGNWGINNGVGSPAIAGYSSWRPTYQGAVIPAGYGAATSVVGAAAAGAIEIHKWGVNNLQPQTMSNLVGTMAYNNGGNWGTANGAAQTLLRNNSTGLGLADRQQAAMGMMSTLGVAGNNMSMMGSQRYAGMLNPQMSQFAAIQAQAGLVSAPMYNRLNQIGVQTIGSNGRGRPMTAINSDIIARLGGGRAMTGPQIQASFRDQTSNFNTTLRDLGMTSDQISILQNQGAAEARVRQQGGDINKFQSLMAQAGGSNANLSRSATTQLRSEFNYAVPVEQTTKARAAAAADKNLSMLGSFTAGMSQANTMIGRFSNAIQNLLTSTGLGGSLGAAGGATGGLSGSFGGLIGTGVATMAGHIVASRMQAVKAMKAAQLASSASPAVEGAVAPEVAAAAGAAGLGVLGTVGIAAGGLLAGGAMAYSGFHDRKLTPRDFLNPIQAPRTAGKLFGKIWGALGQGGPGDGPSGTSVAARAAGFSRAGTNFGVGHCQIFAHTAAGIGNGAPSAIAAWSAAKYKHAGDMSPPVGAFVFWSGGSAGFGHVAISNGGGMVWSTDVKRAGKVDMVSLAWFRQHWPGIHYVGWTEDNNGVRVNVGGAGAVGGATSAGQTGGSAGSKESTGSASDTGASASAGGSPLAMSAYGSINEGDALSQALGGSSGISSGPASPQGSTDGPATTAGTTTGTAPAGNGKGIKGMIQGMAASRGWTGDQWAALSNIISHESGFRPGAKNPTSSAYGLFQMLTEKSSDPTQQTKDGLNYISSRYGDPGKAWSFWQSHHWYDKGAFNIGEDQTARVHKGEMIIPPGQSETIRQALLKDAIPGISSSSGGSGTSLVFSKDSIHFHVNGTMDKAASKRAAKEFVDYIAQDKRLAKMGAGR
jgi:hypothetical protein